jgi:uncharacterized protein
MENKDQGGLVVEDNPAEQRYEGRIGGDVAAIAQYKRQGDTLTFTHTEVLPGNEGKGLGSKLAQQVLQNVRNRNLKVVAQCEFLAGYIGKHPEFESLTRT